MTQSSRQHPGLAIKTLLATDLSARGDRALKRALAMARQDGAQLTVLHVVEEADGSLTADASAGSMPQAPPSAESIMMKRLRQGLPTELGDLLDRATLLIEAGNPAEVIERVATALHVDLIVTGIARENPFSSRPVVLGKTVEYLLRRLPAPILIVRNRVREPYRNILVATDFSAPSGHALQMALRFFPEQTLQLLHATDQPAGDLENLHDARMADFATFLSSVFLPEGDRERLAPLVEAGAPQQAVRDYVQTHDADLVVLGTRGRGAVLEALLGSTAKSILTTLPCDALIVRGPPQ